MAAQDPYIDIRFHAGKVCYLSKEHPFHITIFITLRYARSITIIKQNSVLDPQALLSRDFIEIVDSETGIKVDFTSNKCPSPATQEQPPTNEYATLPHLLTTLDTRSTYVALTTNINYDKSYYLHLDTTPLLPNREYTVSWKTGNEITWWLPISKDSALARAAEDDNNLPSSATPPISYRSLNTAHFFTRSHLVEPPIVTVSLSAPSSTYPVSSPTPFLFTIEFTSQFPRPLTVLADRPLVTSINSDIVLLDAMTSQRVGFDLIDIMDDGPWQEADFLRLTPATPYREERVIDTLEGLEAGKEYVMTFAESAWGWWGEEEIQDLLKEERTRGSGSLPFVAPIKLVCNDRISFWGK